MNWRALAGAVLGVMLLSLLAFGLSRDPRYVPSPLVGGPAPPFDLEGLTGDSVRLSDYAGGVVLINFWASWCLACEQEHPVLEYANQRYGPRGARLVGIVYQDSRSNALRWLKERGGVHWPHGLDHGSRVGIDYGLRGVPETFFVGRDGRVAHRQIGPVSLALIDRLVPQLLAQEPVPASRRPISVPQSGRPDIKPEGK